VSGPLDGEQLRMFMSAREIQSEYAPNEPDRKWLGTNFGVREAMGGAWVREETSGFGRVTSRTSRTDGGINFENPNGPGYLRGPKRVKAPAETDEQLYNRKLAEAVTTKRGKINPYGRGANRVVSIPTLYEDIKAHGVSHPIALGQHESPSGRPSLAGGHHRVAVMAHLNPDQLLPVVHVKDVREANEEGY
jgi:hypothetical protein